jgi:hypothetical protein
VQVRYIHLHCHFSNSKQKYFIKFTQNIPLIYLREKIFAGKGEIKADTVHIPVSGWKHGDYEFTARVTSDGVTYAISPVKTYGSLLLETR